MKIALVHDDLIQWGGAEKVLAEISNIFPEAPVYTALADLSNPLISKHFKDKKIITSFLQKFPLHKKLYKAFMPLYPVAFEQFDFSDFDLVLSQTTRFAKAIITKPHTRHICYIHTPPRFLWNLSGDNTNWLLKPFFSKLKELDLIFSKRVDYWLAGSNNCRERLMKTYEVESKVLYPFVDLQKFNPSKSFEGNYYLIVGRLNKYKKTEVAVEAFKKNGRRLKIVGTGPLFKRLREENYENIEILGSVADELLNSLLAGCKGLIIVGEEDFGMSAIEAQAFGKGVVCFGRGGALETVVNGKTGVYFDKQTPIDLNQALDKFEVMKIDPKDCYSNIIKFSKENFRSKLLEYVAKIRR